jgi:hypothetical protein
MTRGISEDVGVARISLGAHNLMETEEKRQKTMDAFHVYWLGTRLYT